MKLLSSDTCLDAQVFLVGRLKTMPPERRLQIMGAAISAGFGIHRPELSAMDPFEITARVTTFLEQHHVEYFLGGSMASTVYGEPRFTQDVDIVLRLSQDVAERLVDELRQEFYVSEMALEEALVRGGSANLIHFFSNFKIDLILSSETEFEQSEFRRKTRLTVGAHSFFFCSPEDIILAKLEWHKKSGGVLERQLRDVQTVMMVQPALDLDYLRQWSHRLGVQGQLEASLTDSGI